MAARLSYAIKSLPLTPKNSFLEVQPILEEPGVESRCRLKPWRPVTFRRPFLATMILLTVALILVVVLLLVVSSRNQGILFDDDINNLPLRRSFSYLYLPTLISVLYSFLWTWVDLDIKRLEPYFQLSRGTGATSENSILLSYPLEFLVTVPFSAFKRKHWSVLSGSLIMIFILWGLTPTQAGIFAVRSVNISKAVTGQHSTNYTDLNRQGNLSSEYSQSVYNIAWMNETLPPFMTKDYVLSAFGPREDTNSSPKGSNFTGTSTMYSLDVSCEHASLYNSSGFGACSKYGYCSVYGNGRGCEIRAPGYRPFGGKDISKPFDSLYVGYQSDLVYLFSSDDDYYPKCDSRFFNLFFVRWSKSTPATIEYKGLDTPFLKSRDQALNDTSLFCKASYYQQSVRATISLPSQAVLKTEPLGDKLALPGDMFNVSSFELGMATSVVQTANRGEYPTTDFPSSKQLLVDMPLNLYYLPTPAQFAVAAYNRPAEDYLDSETLKMSYQSAYRLFFARQLVEILGKDLDESTNIPASVSYSTQAVVVVPEFAYAALVLLSIILIIAIGVLIRVPARPNLLHSDPSTLRSLMYLVAGDRGTASTFTSLDDSSEKDLNTRLKDANFRLQETGSATDQIYRLRAMRTGNTPFDQQSTDTSIDGQEGNCSAVPSKGVRPFEMKLIIGVIFLLLQVSAVIVFFVLFAEAKAHKGLALPTQSTFVRQLVENYLPIAFATLIEPFWLLLNRLLGLLEPFEELRKGRVRAAKSIDLDYSSLPPQLLFLRAWRAHHFVLALVCSMVLLANVIAVALSGLMYEGNETIDTQATFPSLYRPSLLPLNGTGPPFNINLNFNWDGQTTGEPFYRKMSNLTAKTPLPPWADREAAYLPLDIASMNTSSSLRINASGIGASLDCQPLSTTGDQRYDLKLTNGGARLNVTITLINQTGDSVKCTNFDSWSRLARNYASSDFNETFDAQPGRQALEFNAQLSSWLTDKQNDLFCRQYILAGWMRANLRTHNRTRKLEVIDRNETVLLCKPKIQVSRSIITVDSTGRVQSTVSQDENTVLDDNYLGVRSLIAQANNFLTDSNSTWHNDSFPSDYNNYFIKESQNITSFLDPEGPVPDPNLAATNYATVYKELFALLIVTNFEFLFEKSNSSDALRQVTISTPEIRILFSTPAFIVTEIILVLYIMTTILFYARRPWRVLPRLPSTIASNIAYFAASRALRDMSEIEASGEDVKEATSSWLWSYGTFYGHDGKRHVGVEREVFVNVPKIDAVPRKEER